MRIEEGLWHWTGPTAATTYGSANTGSVYYEAPDALVLVDPVVPTGEEADRFWRALDGDVERVGLQPVVILTTVDHARDHVAIEARYDATTLRAWESNEHGAPSVSDRRPSLPTAVEAMPCGKPGERAIWLPRRRTLVAGTFVHGVDGRGLSRGDGPNEAPATAMLDAELAALAELEPRHVVTCIGPPVIDGGAGALRRALG